MNRVNLCQALWSMLRRSVWSVFHVLKLHLWGGCISAFDLRCPLMAWDTYRSFLTTCRVCVVRVGVIITASPIVSHCNFMCRVSLPEQTDATYKFTTKQLFHWFPANCFICNTATYRSYHDTVAMGFQTHKQRWSRKGGNVLVRMVLSHRSVSFLGKLCLASHVLPQVSPW